MKASLGENMCLGLNVNGDELKTFLKINTTLHLTILVDGGCRYLFKRFVQITIVLKITNISFKYMQAFHSSLNKAKTLIISDE